MTRIIQVHFTSGERLQLNGGHVSEFIENYKVAIEDNASHFTTEGEDKVIINTSHVVFVQETDDQPKKRKVVKKV